MLTQLSKMGFKFWTSQWQGGLDSCGWKLTGNEVGKKAENPGWLNRPSAADAVGMLDADVGAHQLLLAHSWFVRNQALLSAAADDWLHRGGAVHGNRCVNPSLSARQNGAVWLYDTQRLREFTCVPLCRIKVPSASVTPPWLKRMRSFACNHILCWVVSQTHSRRLTKAPLLTRSFGMTCLFLVFLRVFFISSWGEGSRCSTRGCARTARSSWRKSQSCTSCTYLHSGVVFTRTRLPVTDSIIYIFFFVCFSLRSTCTGCLCPQGGSIFSLFPFSSRSLHKHVGIKYMSAAGIIFNVFTLNTDIKFNLSISGWFLVIATAC